MAPGGIVHGFDDLGAAVMNAMNSRAARKYQAEAAAAKAAQDESQFTRGMHGQMEREQVGNAAALARQKAADQSRLAQEGIQQNAANVRNRATNQTQTFNTLAREGGSTVRGLVAGAQRAFTGLGHDVARVLSSHSGSVDGKSEAEWDRVVKEAQAESLKQAPAPDFLQAQIDPSSVTGLPAKRQTALKAALALRGGTLDETGRAVRAPKAPAVKIEPAVAAPGATTGSVQPKAVAPVDKASKIASIRAKLKAKQIDDSAYTDEQLAARYGVK